ncbi:MAG: hypothetical protein OEN02_03905 [Gammaproteobacteria bacterium]|nr:hypothetical protein [Gammaproteobacteria bacterium]MDH3534690.1 hypothetical protein [Gammaproteobacteria bacterium]
MNKIDWIYLRKPLIMLLISILIFAALALAGWQYEKAQAEEYEKAMATLRSTHKIYRNMVNDIDLLDQYRNLYSEYKSTGLVGKERRLSWIESLESTNQALRLPTLTYDLNPQEKFERPGFKVKRGVEVNSSPMVLSIGLLHEEDLFALLEGLRLSIKNLFTVDSCSINRPSPVNTSLDTRRPNLSTKCTIRWVTIDAK